MIIISSVYLLSSLVYVIIIFIHKRISLRKASDSTDNNDDLVSVSDNFIPTVEVIQKYKIDFDIDFDYTYKKSKKYIRSSRKTIRINEESPLPKINNIDASYFSDEDRNYRNELIKKKKSTKSNYKIIVI
jgi:hypothetical protein